MSTALPPTVPGTTEKVSSNPNTNPNPNINANAYPDPKHGIAEKLHNLSEGVKSLFRQEKDKNGKPTKAKNKFEDRYPELREDFPSPSLVDRASLWNS